MLAELKTPSWKDFFIFIGLLLLYTLPGYILYKSFPSLENGNLLSVLSALAVLAAIYPAARMIGFKFGKLKYYLGEFKGELKPAFKYLVLMVAVLFVGDYVYQMALAPWDASWSNQLLFWNDMSNNPATGAERIAAILQNPWSLPVYFLVICVFPPIIEEFVFRRWLYVAMRSKMPVSAAIILNGALFGLMHGKDFAGTAMHGFFFCWVYERSGKLESPILLHAYTNLLAMIIIFGGILLK